MSATAERLPTAPAHTERGGLTIAAPLNPAYDSILTEAACQYLVALVRQFRGPLKALLAERLARQARFDAGELPDFDPQTANIREAEWGIAGIPHDLLDRRVEITGPVERKMIINALNAPVKVYMSCFEDATAPTWQNMVEGQINLRDANLGTISYTSPDNGKRYELGPNPAVLIARPRGLHLPEKHLLVDGEPIPGCLMDFGLYFFHNYRVRMARKSGVYYYIPKLEHSTEAAWWDSVFRFTEKRFGVVNGTIKCTVLIETLPAVFQMNEILFAMRDHIVAMNCGRWDYIFSYIKTLRRHRSRVLPDRQQVTMDKPFLSAYSRLLIYTCHRRGALAMGGMAAFIPAKDEAAMARVVERVRADKEREANNGHDGTWIAHPGLAEVAMGVFNRAIAAGRPNQLQVRQCEAARITAAELLEPCEGTCTDAGMRTNIRISLQYLAAWLMGNGCVPIYGLMEDAATAEISRSSIWQWIQSGQRLDNGKVVTVALFRQMLAEEAEVVRGEVGDLRWRSEPFAEALGLLDEITTAAELVPFLTLPAYLRLKE